MPVEDWEKRADGNIRLWPLIGYEFGNAGGVALMLRLLMAESPEALANKRYTSVQTGLSVEQAEAIADALLRAVREMRAAQPRVPTN